MEAEQKLVESFIRSHPQDAARLVEQWRPEEAAETLGRQAAADAAAVLAKAAPSAALACLEALGRERAAPVLAGFPAPVAAHLLRRAGAGLRSEFLEALPEALRPRVEVHLRYAEHTVGAVMDSQVDPLPDDVTAGEALERIRGAPRHVDYYVYVVERGGRLAGALSLRELLLARPETPIREVMRARPAFVRASAALAGVRSHPAWRKFDALPAADEEGAFVGVIRHRVLRRVAEAAPEDEAVHKGLGTLVALGELYWTGMAELLGNLAEGAAAQPPGRKGA